MKLSHHSLSAIESAIRKAIGNYPPNVQSTITDIYLQPNTISGEFTIYDDDDRELASALIEEWLSREGQDIYRDCERVFRSILGKMKSNGEFDALSLIHPFSFVLVDEEKETVSELLLIDDDTLLVNDELLKGLDKELDSFLKDLLEG